MNFYNRHVDMIYYNVAAEAQVIIGNRTISINNNEIIGNIN